MARMLIKYVIYYGIKMTEQKNIVEATKRDIASVNTAITSLSNIVEKFNDIQTAYDAINSFWGQLVRDAEYLQTKDDVAFTLVGAGLLGTDNNPSLVSAIASTQTLEKAAHDYLAVLDKQGIRLPTTPTPNTSQKMRALHVSKSLDRTATAEAVSTHVNGGEHASSEQFNTFVDKADIAHLLVVHQIQPLLLDRMQEAMGALEGGQHDIFLDKMQATQKLSHRLLLSSRVATAAQGQWIDTSKVQQSLALLSNSSPYPAEAGLPINTGDIQPVSRAQGSLAQDGALATAKTSVLGFLDKVANLSKTCQKWIADHPSPSPSPDQVSAYAVHHTEAVKYCEEATRFAAQANNAFTSVNEQGRAYELDLKGKISGLQGDRNIVNEQMKPDKLREATSGDFTRNRGIHMASLFHSLRKQLEALDSRI